MATVNWDVFFLRVYIPRRRESNMFHGILYACKGMRLRDDEEGYDVCSDDDDRTDEDRDDDDDDYDDGAPKLAAISRGLIAFSLCSISKEKNPWKKMLDIRKKNAHWIYIYEFRVEWTIEREAGRTFGPRNDEGTPPSTILNSIRTEYFFSTFLGRRSLGSRVSSLLLHKSFVSWPYFA